MVDPLAQRVAFDTALREAAIGRISFSPSDSSSVTLRVESGTVPTLDDREALWMGFLKLEAAALDRDIFLTISGGGYGCFFLDMNAGRTNVDDLLELVQSSDGQAALDEMRADAVSIRHGGKVEVFASYYEKEISFVTNRARSHEVDEGNALTLFGGDYSTTIEVGLVKVQIPSPRLKPGPWYRRLWKRVVSRPNLHPKRLEISEVSVTITDWEGLSEHWRTRGLKAGLVNVHGFAMSFEAAVKEALLQAHNLELERFDVAPIIFSWPSAGSKRAYDSDQNNAERTRMALIDSLAKLKKLMPRLDVIAHSHGNRLLMEALKLQEAAALPERCLHRAILFAPDIDTVSFEQGLPKILRAFDRVSLYFSNLDFALFVSAEKFHSSRAGQGGVATGERLEIIDASDVATGLIGHSYHVNAAPVTQDIFYLLQGMPADKRIGLRKRPDGVWTFDSN